MNKSYILLVFGLALWAVSSTGMAQDEHKGTIEINAAKAENITLDIPVGKVSLSESRNNTISAEFTAYCDPSANRTCDRDMLKTIAWSQTNDHDDIQLALTPKSADSYNGISMQVHIAVPAQKMIELEFDYGDLDVRNVNACFDITAIAGNLEIVLEEAALSSASLKARVGNVSLATATETLHGERLLLVGSKLEWHQGTGACPLNAEVATGNIQLRLN